MKIKVNKNQQNMEFRKTVWSIVEIAKQKAENGIEHFHYSIPRGLGFGSYEIIKEVEQITEETVYAGYRSVKDGTIRFSISN
jgi:hypothetical protein